MEISTIVGLVLSALGAISGGIWLRDKFRRQISDRSFHSVFNITDSDMIVVVPTGGKCFDRDPNGAIRTKPDFHTSLLAAPDELETLRIEYQPNILTTVEDSMARGLIVEAFVKHGINTDVRLHTSITEADRAKNLFLICGPVGNSVTRAVLQRKDVVLPFRFGISAESREWQISDAKGLPMHPLANFQTSDYALIVKLDNPFSGPGERTKLFICAGIEGLGTWGACALVVKHPDWLTKRLAHELGLKPESNFCAFVSVSREGGGLPFTNLSEVRGL